MNAPVHRSRGFTLLEVLVALVVLSVGLLGLTGLQATSLRNNHSAFLRSQATVAINDIMDRIRANRAVAKNGLYALPMATTAGSLGAPCSASCTGQQLRTRDQIEWLQLVGRLPNGDGSIVMGTIGGDPDRDLVTVSVQWNDDRTGNLQTLESRTQL